MQVPLTPDRQTFRAALAALASKTQAKLPQLNGRVEKACKLVLAGDVTLQGEKALVASLSDPAKTYTLEPGHCTCADFPRAPEYLCAHRLAAGFQRKLGELLPLESQGVHGPLESQPTPPAAPLPEARSSANVRLKVAGHEVQVTLRDHDEAVLMVRVEELIQRYGQPQASAEVPRHHEAPQAPAEPEKRYCPKHGTEMALNHKEGRSWWSHKTAEGWCKGK